jgi:hypothetical protein
MKQSVKQEKWKKEHYRSNKKLYADKQMRRKKDIKLYLHSLKNPCVACGEKDTSCIDFHHVKPNEKEETLANVITNKWGKERIDKEIKKCVCLCSNCHRKLHFYGWTVKKTIKNCSEK